MGVNTHSVYTQRDSFPNNVYLIHDNTTNVLMGDGRVVNYESYDLHGKTELVNTNGPKTGVPVFINRWGVQESH